MVSEAKIERQKKLEQEALEYSYAKFNKQVLARMNQGALSELPHGIALIKLTIDSVALKIKEFFDAPKRGDEKLIEQYLIDYKDRPEDLAFLLLTVLINKLASNPRNNNITVFNNAIAEGLYYNYVDMKLQEQQPKLYSYLHREYKKRGKGYIRTRIIKLGQLKANLIKDNNVTNHKISALLISLVLKSGIDVFEQYTYFEKKKSKTTYKLRFTANALQLLDAVNTELLANNRKFPILICEPAPWTGYSGSGGYYQTELYKFKLLKVKNKNTHRALDAYFQKGKLDRYIDVINNIQKTKWRINRRVYDVIKEVLDLNLVDDSSITNNPYLIGGIPFSRPLEVEDFVKRENFGNLLAEDVFEKKEDYKKWFAAKEIQQGIINTIRGKAIQFRLAFADATTYVDEEEIYFSYQADFRGRVYPIQQHLNPQSKGEVKSFLEFANGVPIETEEQIRWFQIHGANCYGKDKLEYDDRIDFIQRETDNILLVAKDPIEYKHLWKDTDEPYLYLAWCFEYADYLNDPQGFRSHIPIALDATCSGLQIYSGLLLDEEGASSVNVRGQTREDVYQKVADRANDMLEKGDYLNEIYFTRSDGEEVTLPTAIEANSLKGKVTRSLTKRNTMTVPYSVSTYGMYEQLDSELKELEDNGKAFWDGDRWVVARLLTDLNNRAINQVVKGARIGQDFLKEITKDLVKENKYVWFTTPIFNFPLLQKINKTKPLRYRSALGRLTLQQPTDELHQIKMVNGIAPNFIHSLDATLMFLTVEKLVEAGCESFHLIHDSFGVPINQIENLNKSVRSSYVELFKTNPLKGFVKQVAPTKLDLVDNIMINTLDLDEVLDSKYIFS